MPTEKVNLVLTEKAIASLRESDFDTSSSVGEVIDNSIQAGATEINLSTKETELPVRGRRQQGATQITEIAFGDNGHGMDSDTLQHCLQLGFSTRYGDRSGIGRFGVGMTLAAINQCKRIEIYSKPKPSSDWLYTYIDLEEIHDNPYIAAPKKKKLPAEYEGLVNEKHGTLVIWKKCDRPTATTEEINHWVARTYRKYIGEYVVSKEKVIRRKDNVVIKINGEKVKPFDPLYAIRGEGFPEGPCAILYPEIEMDMPVPLDARNLAKTSPVTIRMSLLPEHWRKESGAGGSPLAKRLRIPENEGFSVVRAGREIFYDVMPRFEPRVHADGIDRWWSAEISFDPVLDSYFSVRNIKRGARFTREIREKVQEIMRPTILEARRQVSGLFAETRAQHVYRGQDVSTEHTEAESTVKAVRPTPGKAGRGMTEVEKKEEIEEIIKEIVTTHEELDAWVAKIENQPCTIVDNEGTSWKGDTFLDVHPQGGRTIIEYNRSHDFFVFVYGVIKDLTNAGDRTDAAAVVEDAKKLKTAIDLLFMAYAQAESQLDPEYEQRAADTLLFLKSNWGVLLRQFVRAYERNQQK